MCTRAYVGYVKDLRRYTLNYLCCLASWCGSVDSEHVAAAIPSFLQDSLSIPGENPGCLFCPVQHPLGSMISIVSAECEEVTVLMFCQRCLRIVLQRYLLECKSASPGSSCLVILLVSGEAVVSHCGVQSGLSTI